MPGENEMAKSAIVQWSPPRPENDADDSCPVTGYQIRYKIDGSREALTEKVDGGRGYIHLGYLNPHTTYKLRVVGILCGREKTAPSRWFTFSTTSRSTPVYERSETEVPGRPTGVRTRTFINSVIISWLPPEDESIVVRGYICGYGEGVPDVMWKYVDASRRNVTIDGLKAATQYVISLRAYNHNGNSDVIHELISTRESHGFVPDGPPDTILPPPTQLRAKVLSPNTAWLQWFDPSLDQSQEIRDTRHYNVHCQAQPNGKTLSVIVKALRVVIYDLEPGTQYMCKVRTVLNTSSSSFSREVVNRTFETAPGSAPRSIMVEQGDIATQVQVTWRTPRQPNGVITGYSVLYSVDSTLSDREWYVKSVEGDIQQASIAAMVANTTYFFKMQARNSNGQGPMSDVVAYTTAALRQIPASTPRDVMAEEGDLATEVRLSWTKPSTIHSPINGYVIYYTWRLDTPPPDWLVKQVRSVSLETVITGLSPNRNYFFKVVAQTNRGLGQISETVECYTRDVGRPEEAQSTEIPLPNSTVDRHLRVPDVRDGWEHPTVIFQTQVQHTVNVYITWPETLTGPCDRVSSGITGYVLRYYRVADVTSDTISNDVYTTYTLRNNFVVLSGLIPDSVYRYQVKYLMGQSGESGWSSNQSISTHYQPAT